MLPKPVLTCPWESPNHGDMPLPSASPGFFQRPAGQNSSLITALGRSHTPITLTGCAVCRASEAVAQSGREKRIHRESEGFARESH